jgi:hypothetical protein
MTGLPDLFIQIEPGLTDLSMLIDLLVEQTKELNGADPEAQKMGDRVHALAGACLLSVNEVFASIDRLRLLHEVTLASSNSEMRA